MWETLTSYKVLISPSTPIWSIKVKRTVASMTLAFDVPNYRGCQKCNSDKQGYGLMALSSYKYFHICKVLQCLPGADFFSQLPWFWVNPTKMQDEKNMFFFLFCHPKTWRYPCAYDWPCFSFGIHSCPQVLLCRPRIPPNTPDKISKQQCQHGYWQNMQLGHSFTFGSMSNMFAIVENCVVLQSGRQSHSLNREEFSAWVK